MVFDGTADFEKPTAKKILRCGNRAQFCTGLVSLLDSKAAWYPDM